jgi:hypothetical protein
MRGRSRDGLALGKVSLWLRWGFEEAARYGRPRAGSVENTLRLGFGVVEMVGRVLAGARREGELSWERRGLGFSRVLRDALGRESSACREAAGVCLLEAGRVGPATRPGPRTSDGATDPSRTPPKGVGPSPKPRRNLASGAVCGMRGPGRAGAARATRGGDGESSGKARRARSSKAASNVRECELQHCVRGTRGLLGCGHA